MSLNRLLLKHFDLPTHLIAILPVMMNKLSPLLSFVHQGDSHLETHSSSTASIKRRMAA